MWVLGQSCRVSAAEEAEANEDGWQRHFTLFCSPKSDQIKDYCKQSEWSELLICETTGCTTWMTGNVSATVDTGECGWWSRAPFWETLCQNLFTCKALLCMCSIPLSYCSDKASEEATRASFPAGLLSSCPDCPGSNGWELCVFHAIEFLHLWAPPESLPLAGFPLKPSTPAAFIKHFPSTPPTPPALHIKTLGCVVMSPVSFCLSPELCFALPSTHYCLSPFLHAVGCLTQMSWPDSSCPNACSIHACSKYDHHSDLKLLEVPLQYGGDMWEKGGRLRKLVV